MSRGLPVGKLPESLLRGLLRRVRQGPRTLLGPAIGEDAAAVRIGGRALIAAADPITFAAEDIGEYALIVNANDVACRGARPRWFLATTLLPEGTRPAAVRRMFAQLLSAARRLNVELIGGHTEVTSGIDRPIISGCMLGEASPDRIVRTSGVRPGDAVLLTKGVPLEAASIAARERRRELSRTLPKALLDRCARLGRRLSVVEEALAAVRLGRVHAMHDPTEGGLSTGLYELAAASRVAIDVCGLPVLEEPAAVMDALGLDPLGAIASGALLIAAPPKDARGIAKGLRRRDIDVWEIGRARRGRGVKIVPEDRPMPRFPRDELAKLF